MLTADELELAAKAHWDAENDMLEGKRAIHDLPGDPWVRYEWRDKRLPILAWTTRIDLMRAALTEVDLAKAKV